MKHQSEAHSSRERGQSSNTPAPPKPVLEGLTEIAKLCLRTARDGDSTAALGIEGVLVELLSPEAKRQQTEALWSNPLLAALIASRPLLPPGFETSMVDDCAPGTLGHSYARFMREFNLSQDFYPVVDTSTDLQYFRRRMMETHDIWHVLTGCRADVQGELEVIGFYLGHFGRYLNGPLRMYLPVVGLSGVLGLVYCAHADSRRLPKVIWGILRNMRRGYRTKPLFGVHWEKLWHRPLAEVQAELVAAS